jgi:hypothetical protein
MNLVPHHLNDDNRQGTKKSLAFGYPLTPYWEADAKYNLRALSQSVSASGFYDQNGLSYDLVPCVPEDDEGGTIFPPHPEVPATTTNETEICGSAAYKELTVDANKSEDGETTLNTQKVFTKSLEIENTPGAEYFGIRTAVTGSDTFAGSSPAHSQTATFSKSGDSNNPCEHSPNVWRERQLSSAVDGGYLQGRITSWKAESEDYRLATGGASGPSPFPDYKSYRTESNDGRAAVGGGHYIFDPASPFSETLPTPGASEGDLWNGNFFYHIHLVTRKLGPVIYGVGGGSHQGTGIYNAGYTEDKLTDIITANPWKDDFGIYDNAAILDNVPLECSSSHEGGTLYTFPYKTEEGEANEVMFVSRTGQKLRVTYTAIEGTRVYNWEEGGYDDYLEILSTDVIVLDEVTKRGYHTFEVDPAYRWGQNDPQRSIVPTLIERWDATEEEWVKFAERILIEGIQEYVEPVEPEEGEEPEPEPLPLPSNYIGVDVTDTTLLILIAFQAREGVPWGHSELYPGGTGARYRTRTRTVEKTININLAEGDCGGSIGGSYDLVAADEYSDVTGLLLPQDISTFSMMAGGADWTSADELVFGQVWGSDIQTPTVMRDTSTSPAFDGRFELRWDGSGGKILSEQWIKVAASELVDGVNSSGWRDIPTASAGQSVSVEGVRLAVT